MVAKFGVRSRVKRYSSRNRGAALVENVLLLAVLALSVNYAVQSVGDHTRKLFMTACQVTAQGGGSCSTTGDDRGPPAPDVPIIRP